jgi:hypothetical protein
MIYLPTSMDLDELNNSKVLHEWGLMEQKGKGVGLSKEFNFEYGL